MKRAFLFVLLALSLTGCAVRAGYYGRDGYWRDHDRYGYRYPDTATTGMTDGGKQMREGFAIGTQTWARHASPLRLA